MKSRSIDSPQNTMHENLHKILIKNSKTKYLAPIADHNKEAFNLFKKNLSGFDSYILDTGCGVGESSIVLAKRFAHSAVFGLDRSLVRLAKTNKKYQDLPLNLFYIRTDLIDFWRLLKEESEITSQLLMQCFYYPNPYPKAGQVKKRWHAHPIFKDILSLGGKFEVRSNWKIYLDEFKEAVSFYGASSGEIRKIELTDEYISLFEKKYHESKQAIWGLEGSFDTVENLERK